MHVEDHHTQKQLRDLLRKQRNAKVALRLQAVSLAKAGKTAVEIPQLLPLSRRTVQIWIGRYNQYGSKGLQDNHVGGNSFKLNEQQKQKLINYIDSQASDPCRGIRRAEDLRDWMKQNIGVPYSLSGVYYLLHSLGYSCLMPRPRHHKADLEAQQEFKKNFWTRSSNYQNSISTKK